MTRLPYEFKVWVPEVDGGLYQRGGLDDLIKRATQVAGGCSTTYTSGSWWSISKQAMVYDCVKVFTWFTDTPEKATILHRDVSLIARALIDAGEEAVLVHWYGCAYLLTLEDFKEKESKWSVMIRKLFGQR